MLTEPELFDLNDFREDPITQAIHAINLAIASWEPDVRTEVYEVLGDLAIACSKGSKHFHFPAAELLARVRVLMLLVGQEADDARAGTRTKSTAKGADRGNS